MAKRTPAAKKAEAKVATEYVVLEQIEAPIGEAEIVDQAWLPVKHLVDEGTPDAGWRVTVFTAPSKQSAIRQHTGEGADVVEGTWKAIPLSSWKGGETTKRVTAAARLPLLDG